MKAGLLAGIIFTARNIRVSFNFVDNQYPTIPKTFLSLSMQVNELMITTVDGITTSLGQLSELSEIDFLKDHLNDGVSAVNIFDKEGVYFIRFLAGQKR